MKKPIFLGISLLFAACQPFSFEEPQDKRSCLAYMSDSAAITFDDEGMGERTKGYLLPMYYPGKADEILFLQRAKDERYAIIHLNLNTQEAVSLHESEFVIWSFDMNDQEELLWVESPGELTLRQRGQASALIPFSAPITQAKWSDSGIVVSTVKRDIYLIDSTGQVVSQMIPPAGADWKESLPRPIWNVSGQVLMVEKYVTGFEKQMLMVYRLPHFGLIDSIDIRAYANENEASLRVGTNRLSLDFRYPDQLLLSRVNRMFLIDLSSRMAQTIWERTSCLVAEPGISLSPNGDALVAGCSQLTKSPLNNTGTPRGEKERGLMLLQDGFTTLSTSYP